MEADTAPPPAAAEPPADATDASTATPMPPREATNTATVSNQPEMRTIVLNMWPKGLSRKLYNSKKPGRERKELLARYRRKDPVKTTTVHYRPIVTQPWNPNKAAEATTAQAQKGTKQSKPPVTWTTMDKIQRKEYLALDPGYERRDYLNKYRKRHGVAPVKAKVPNNFMLPEGLHLEEFYARPPGRYRMAYLAKYLKKNNLELKSAPRPATGNSNPPIGRGPEPLAHPRCGCSSSEACSSCSRCVELHCTCGLTGRQRRAVCLESRACSCALSDPTSRCKLCHGCRQLHGLSHCRCVLHQRLLWIKRHPELKEELTEEEEESSCSCFLLAHRHGGAMAMKEKKAGALKETERVRRIKRASGFPSSDNIYRSQKITTFLGEDGVENDLDDGVEDGLGAEILPPRTEHVIPRTMTTRMLDPAYNPASYHALFRSEGSSLLESIEPRNGRISRRETAALVSVAMSDQITRGLENFVFEADRNAIMPSDDLVEYLVYMASIKAANTGELIGTFEDSAAVAGGIVVEEYMAQLIEDATIKHRALCSATESSVKKFTEELLLGFNWHLFQQQHPCPQTDSKDNETALADKVGSLILREFLSTQPKAFDVEVHTNDLTKWIRSAITISPYMCEKSKWLSGTGATSSQQASDNATIQCGSDVGDGAEPAKSPQIRLSVKANPVHGKPAYNLHFSTTLKDGHHVETSVGGLDSKVKAKATVLQLSKVVERQELRSKGLLKDSLPPSPPEPSPPEYKPAPLPPLDPQDPYFKMHAHLREHFAAYLATQPPRTVRTKPRGRGRPRKEKRYTPY